MGVDIGGAFGSPFGVTGTIGDFLSLVLRTSFTLAGLIILFLFLFAGWNIIAGAGQNKPENVAKGKSAATSALIGFVIIFVSYWIVQFLQYFFNFYAI